MVFFPWGLSFLLYKARGWVMRAENGLEDQQRIPAHGCCWARERIYVRNQEGRGPDPAHCLRAGGQQISLSGPGPRKPGNVCRLGLARCSGWGMEGTVGLPSVPNWTSRIIQGWPLMCVAFPWQCLLYRPLTFSMTTSGEESRITMMIWTSRTSWTLFRRR